MPGATDARGRLKLATLVRELSESRFVSATAQAPGFCRAVSFCRDVRVEYDSGRGWIGGAMGDSVDCGLSLGAVGVQFYRQLPARTRQSGFAGFTAGKTKGCLAPRALLGPGLPGADQQRGCIDPVVSPVLGLAPRFWYSISRQRWTSSRAWVSLLTFFMHLPAQQVQLNPPETP